MEEDEDATLLDPRLDDGFEDVAGDVGALWSGVRGSVSSFCTAGEGMFARQSSERLHSSYCTIRCS